MNSTKQKEKVVFYVGMSMEYKDKIRDQVDTLSGSQYDDWIDTGIYCLAEYILQKGVGNKLDIFLKDNYTIVYECEKSKLTEGSDWDYELIFYLADNQYKDIYTPEDKKRYENLILYHLEELVKEFIEKDKISNWESLLSFDLADFLHDEDFYGHELTIVPSILTSQEAQQEIEKGNI